MKKIGWLQAFRIAVLSAFLIFITIAAVRHQVKGGGPDGSPSIHSICPFGGLEAIYQILAGGEFIKKTNTANMVLLSGTIILAILFGRYFCGWLCAIGFLQELFGKAGKMFLKRTLLVPSVIDKPLRYLKYILLAGTLFFTWKMADLVIAPYDPFAAYAHIPAGLGELLGEFLAGSIILAATLLLSVFYDRVFCKYLCPMGAFLGLISKISGFKIIRDTATCINCNKCTVSCPGNIPVARMDSVKSTECINCLECVTACPTRKLTLKPVVFGKYIRPVFLGTAGLAIYLGIIGAANIAGIWKTTEPSLAAVVTKGGALDPYSIRGFMTLKEVSETFHIELGLIYKELGVSPDQIPPTVRIKELGRYSDKIKEDSVREAVAKLIGQLNVSQQH